MNTEAIFSQIESLVSELRRKNEKNEKKNVDAKPVNWVLLPISGNELLMCDICHKPQQQQEMHISIYEEQQKVLCGKCWKAKEAK